MSKRYENYDLDVNERNDKKFRTCPMCGERLEPMEEKYDLNSPFYDRWWECPQCGYCETRG